MSHIIALLHFIKPRSFIYYIAFSLFLNSTACLVCFQVVFAVFYTHNILTGPHIPLLAPASLLHRDAHLERSSCFTPAGSLRGSLILSSRHHTYGAVDGRALLLKTSTRSPTTLSPARVQHIWCDSDQLEEELFLQDG